MMDSPCCISGFTTFSRDDTVLRVLDEVILPSYYQATIASVGCSIGKEVYSILLRNWPEREKIKIDGYDISEKRISMAREGTFEVFELESLNEIEKIKKLNIPKELYTLKPKSGCSREIEFSEEIKNMVNFEVHDISQEPLPKKYDVVLMLNVLMYYPPEERENILSNVNKSAKENGWLLCESEISDGWRNEKIKQYEDWMNDISRFGFEKQPYYPRIYRLVDQDIS